MRCSYVSVCGMKVSITYNTSHSLYGYIDDDILWLNTFLISKSNMVMMVLPCSSQGSVPHSGAFDALPLFPDYEEDETNIKVGQNYQSVLQKRRRLDVLSIATPMKCTDQRTVTIRKSVAELFKDVKVSSPGEKYTKEHVRNDKRSPASKCNHASKPAPIPYIAHRIIGKRKPPDWWYLEGETCLAQAPPMPWTVNRKAGDLFQTWILRQLYGVEDLEYVPYAQKRGIIAEEWSRLDVGEKAQWLLAASRGRSVFPVAGDSHDDGAAIRLPVGCTRSMVEEHQRYCGMLLTWHGQWGFADADVQQAVESFEGVDDTLSAVLAELPYYQSLGKEFFAFCMQALPKCGLSQLSVSVEHCLKGSSPERVHLHAYMSGGRVRLHDQLFELLEFQEVAVCHVAFCGYAQKGDKSGENFAKEGNKQRWWSTGRSAEGHYYLQFQKVGSLYRATNYNKFEDFAVPARWIMNQYKQRKMAASTALSELVECRDRVRGSFAELEFQMQKQSEKLIAEMEMKAKEEYQKHMRPFRSMPASVMQWKQQYKAGSGQAQDFRFVPLVLDGETRFGKSSWAMSFFGVANTLVVNCQNITHPNLLPWKQNPFKYKAILFDEGSWALIFENKMLFQAGINSVDLGQSQTNINAYKVFVRGVPMIVTSNQFWKDVSDEARKYLEQNIVYYEVTKPCYT